MLSVFNKILKRELHGMNRPPAKKEISQTRTYFVNAFKCKNAADQSATMVGLFNSNAWTGLPGFAKNLGNEYYVGVKLLAYYRVKPHRYVVNFNSRCGDVKVCGKRYDKIPIISRYDEKRLQADSPEAAIEKFTNFAFE